MVLKVLTDGKIFVSNLDYKLVAKTDGLDCHNNHSGSVAADTTEGSKTDFDRVLQNRWETHMSKGHFRYGLDVLETRKVIHGGSGDGESLPFVAQYNPMRATQRRKPEIMTSVASQPFDKEKFHFGKVKEAEEVIFSLKFEEDEGVLNTENDDVIINASPIEYGHSLLVPNRLHGQHPQVLTERSVMLAIRLVMLSGMTNFKAAFNSLCAYASVNHLHWHLYYMSSGFPLPVETCTATLIGGDPEIYEIENYSAKGFAFQIKRIEDIQKVSSIVFAIANLLCDLNIAHNLFITRGTAFNSKSEGKSGGSDEYDVIRVFLWARCTVEGGKDPGAFVIATCELGGHILIYDRQEYDSIDYTKISNAQKDTCQSTFVSVKPLVLQMLSSLHTKTA